MGAANVELSAVVILFSSADDGETPAADVISALGEVVAVSVVVAVGDSAVIAAAIASASVVLAASIASCPGAFVTKPRKEATFIPGFFL